MEPPPSVGRFWYSQRLVAHVADPVGAPDVVLPAGLAHPGLAGPAEGAAVEDPPQLGAAPAARARGVRRPHGRGGRGRRGLVPAADGHDAEGAALLQHGQLSLQPAAKEME